MLTAIVAIALGAGQSPHKINDFHMRGADGRHYDFKSLAAGKPLLMFYLRMEIEGVDVAADGTFTKYRPDGFGKPNGVRDINRLSAMLRGKVRVAAFTHGTYRELRQLVRQTGCKFLLLGEDNPYSTNELSDQILLGYNYRDLYHLHSALILPDRRLAMVWPGYSRASLAQMQRLVARYTNVRPRLDLSRFPKRRQAGDAEMYGLPGP
jgi:hypothetical protein